MCVLLFIYLSILEMSGASYFKTKNKQIVFTNHHFHYNTTLYVLMSLELMRIQEEIIINFSDGVFFIYFLPFPYKLL